MGMSILDLVLMKLKQYGFTADVAFPGQKYPAISDTVAAVHLESVDRTGRTVTVEVNIISPAALGGTHCEVEALRATEALRWAGGRCIQKGCTYDGVSQVYMVAVQATFIGVTGEDSYTAGPGFLVFINNSYHSRVRVFREEESGDCAVAHAMGETLPTGLAPGNKVWKLYLEEMIPYDSPEQAEPAGEFTLKVQLPDKTETYTGCRWTQVQRELSQDGLRRIRTGFALGRQEAENE